MTPIWSTHMSNALTKTQLAAQNAELLAEIAALKAQRPQRKSALAACIDESVLVSAIDVAAIMAAPVGTRNDGTPKRFQSADARVPGPREQVRGKLVVIHEGLRISVEVTRPDTSA
jgi:hypothetical protein